MARYTDHYQIRFDADTEAAKQRIIELQQSLTNLTQVTPFSRGFDNVGITQLREASQAAAELKAHLLGALNVRTGKLDLSKLNQSLKVSGRTLQQYQAALTAIGPSGQAAFRQLSMAIMTAEQPIVRLSNHVKNFATTLANTAKWQLSSSMIHSFVGGVQKAYHYTQSLNKSLNNIRIVTGQTTKQMEDFAKRANIAARELSATTRDYTDAALIFYQQGLNDEAVQARTDTVIKMANVTGEAAEDVSSYMTAIWNNFAKGSESLEYYSDVITTLGAVTAASSEEIAQGLEKFAAVSDTVGLSYEYATAALATVVSETRQSADIVGNSFKTLFSRIEGLSLGETLEDGTDLNKYSAALASVGINIKDQVGNLRSMNDILDDLGKKWKTLSNDQQVALAQTVGGVRQYTQLISLMDNYDTFKINVELAEGSEGSLQKQANIYAQSWEAARDRVTASAEGIYDALLDEDTFIALADFTSFFLDSIGGFINGVKGLGGVIAPVGYLLTTLFKDKLAGAITSAHYSLKGLTAAGREEMDQLKREAQAGYVASYRTGEGRQRAAGENVASGLGELYQTYLDNSENFTQAEQNIVATLLEQNRARADAVTEQARLNDELERTQRLTERRLMGQQGRAAANRRMSGQVENGIFEFSTMASTDDYSAPDEYVQAMISREEQRVALYNAVDGGNRQFNVIADQGPVDPDTGTQTMTFAGEASDMATLRDSIVTDFVQQTEGLYNIRNIFNEIAEPVASINLELNNINDENLQNLIDTASRADSIFDEVVASMGEENFNAGFGDASESVVRYTRALKETLAQLRRVQEAETRLANIRRRRERGESGERIDREEQEAQNESQSARQSIANSQDENSADNMGNLMDDIAQREDDMVNAATNARAVLVEGFGESAQQLDTITSNAEQMSQGILDGARATVEFKEGIDGTQQSMENLGNKTSQLSQQIVGFVQGISSLAMGLNALKGIANIWTDESLSGGEKMLSTLMAMTTVLPLVTTLTKLLSAEESKNTLVKIANILASNRQKVADEKNIVVKGLLTLATWGLAAAQAVLNAIQNYGAVIGIAVGAVAVGAIITMAALTSSSKKRAKAAEAEAEAAKEAAESTNKEAEANRGLIDTYQDAKDQYEETAENKKEYLDATFALIDAYKIEGGAVMLLAGQYEELDKAIRKARTSELDRQIKDNTYQAQLTGANMMEKLTDGKGFESGGKYKIEFNDWGSGGQKEEATMYSILKSSNLKTLRFDAGSGDVQATVDLSNPDQLLQYYNELKYVTKTALEKNKNIASSDLYMEMMEEIGELEAAGIDDVSSSMEVVHEAQIESVIQSTENSLGLKTDEIESIADYENFVGSLETNLTNHFKSLGYTGEELQKFVDQGLDNLINSSEKLKDFSVESQGFKDLDLQWQDQDAIEFYEGLSDEEKEVFWTLDLNEAESAEQVRSWLDDMQDLIAQKKFVVQIEVQENLAELIKEGINSENLGQVKEAFNKAVEQGFTDISWEEFRDMSDEQRNDLVNSWGETISEEQNLNAENILKNAEATRQKDRENVSKQEANYSRAVQDADLIGTWQKSTTKYEDPIAFYQAQLEMAQRIGNETMAKGAQAALDIFTTKGIQTAEDLEALNAAQYAVINDAMWAYNGTIGDSSLIPQWKADNERRQYYAKMSMDKAYVQQSNNNASIEEAQIRSNQHTQQQIDKVQERLGITDEEIVDYTKHLQENSAELAKYDDIAQDIAVTTLRLNKGVEKLGKSWKDYNDILKEGKKDTPQALAALEAYRENISDILNTDKAQISDDFILKHLDTIGKIAEGDLEAVEKLQDAAAADILLGVDYDEDGINQTEQRFLDLIESVSGEDLEIGATLDDSQFASALYDMMVAQGKSVEEMQAAFDRLGWSAEIEYVPMTYKAAYNMGHRTFYSDDSGTTEIGNTDSTLTEDATVYVPQFNRSKTVYRGAPKATLNSSGSNSSGGGGKEKKKVENEAERYHEISRELEALRREAELLGDAKDDAFGQSKIDLIDQEISYLEKELQLYEDLEDEIESYLAQDKGNIARYGATFDERGNISNYTELMTKLVDDFNSGAMGEEEFEAATGYLEQYEETLDKWYENQADKIAKQREIVQKELDKINAKVEIELELSQKELEWIEYQLKKIEDSAFNAAQSIDLLTGQIDQAIKDSDTYSTKIQDLYDLANENMSKGLYVETGGWNSDMKDALNEATSNLLQTNSTLLDTKKQIQEQFGIGLDEMGAKLDEQLGRFESYGAIFGHYINILNLSGKSIKNAGLIIDIGNKNVENSINKLASAKSKQDALEASLASAHEQYQAALMRGDAESAKYWEEEIEKATIKVEEGWSSFNATIEETLQAAADNFSTAMEQIIAVFESGLTTFDNLTTAQDQYDKQKTLNEQFLTTTTQAYELSKLMRNLNNEIAKTDNLAAKVKLRDVLEEINEIQSNNTQLTQYDLDLLNAKYELRLAEIALEEAQNAKSQVRLTQTAGGGWGYVYTADQEKVDEAYQNYEDKLYAMQQLSEEAITEYSDQILQNQKEMSDALLALREQQWESDEAYYAERDRIVAFYTERDLYLQQQLDKAVVNSGQVYADTLLSQITGAQTWEEGHAKLINGAKKTIVEIDKAYANWKDQVTGAYTAAGLSLTDFREQVEEDSKKIQSASQETANDLKKEAESYADYLVEILNKITSFQAEYTQRITNLVTANEAVVTSANNMIVAYSHAKGAAWEAAYAAIAAAQAAAAAWAAASGGGGGGSVSLASLYGNNVPTKIGSDFSQLKEVNGVYYAKDSSGYWVPIDREDPIYSGASGGMFNIIGGQAYSDYWLEKIKRYDTGGYTGEWGPSGKLAMLHEKEIVLNKQDTVNLLNSIEIVRSIASQLDALNQYARLFDLTSLFKLGNFDTPQQLEQNVHITAEFNGVQDHNEIELALSNLINYSSQYINRYNK